MDDFSQPLALEGGLHIPAWELTERFVTSPGPGGQNVNKVATAVELRWSVAASSLPAAAKERIARRWASRLTKEGEFVLQVSTHRSQARNRMEARERLVSMVEAALKVQKRRVATKPTHGSVRRRLKAKAVRGEVKAGRGRVEPGEE